MPDRVTFKVIAYAYHGPDNIHRLRPTLFEGRIHQIDFFLKYITKDKQSFKLRCENIAFWGNNSKSTCKDTSFVLNNLREKKSKPLEYSIIDPVFSLFLVYCKRQENYVH
jgi:hypothetical protein